MVASVGGIVGFCLSVELFPGMSGGEGIAGDRGGSDVLAHCHWGWLLHLSFHGG
jgi:hypothetical protein